MKQDIYESTYILEPGERPLHRDKTVDSVSNLVGMALLGVPSLALPIVGLWWSFGSIRVDPLDLLMLAVPMLLMLCVLPVMFVVRVVVTDRHVHAHQGPWGSRVPLEAIRSVRVVRRSLLDQFRVERGRVREVASFAGFYRAAEYVEIAWEDDAGARTLRIRANEAHALARAIESARAEDVVLDVASEEEEREHVELAHALS